MIEVRERKRLAQDVFSLTGQRLDEDDPVTVAALFYAQLLREASESAVEQTQSVNREAAAAVQEAMALCRNFEAERNAFATEMAKERTRREVEYAIERRKLVAELDGKIQRCVKIASRNNAAGAQSDWLPWPVSLAFTLGMFVFAAMVTVACDFNFSWVQDAKIGRAFIRATPDLDPGTRAKLLGRLEKHRK
ncbi:hypothetical protein [Herbaspirillum sp. SJZ107]|uniref:hypothetical protein n=1 Tax=Herbaspirillum sp. SJZ107 TaxID=2572881 RepID=UPI0011503349|nr:hypothetical protein [Herbaspirillum sp. SJZ107]